MQYIFLTVKVIFYLHLSSHVLSAICFILFTCKSQDTNFTHQTAHQLVRSLDYPLVRLHDYKLTNLTIDRDNSLISWNSKPDKDIIYNLQRAIIHDSPDNRLNTEAGALIPKKQTKSI